MRILAFADIHGSSAAIRTLKKKSRNVDLILNLGDFTIFQSDMQKIIKKLDAFGKPQLIIPGNHEDEEDVEKALSKTKNMIYLNESYYATDELIVLAAEGNGFSFRDPVFEKAAKKLARVLKHHKGKKYILMTHAPPYGTSHDSLAEEHCGNKSIRDFIRKTGPDYALCGHIHENFYTKDRIKKTITLNPGPMGRIITI